MALVLKDRVKQTAAAPGTGTITLGATVAGFQSFSSVGNGNTTYFAIVDPISGAWEVNYGVYTSSGTTLTRNATPLSSSTGTLVNFTGAVDVFVTYPSENAVWRDTAGVVVQQSFGAITATSAALTSGTITGAPVNATDIVNKEYADSIASGLNYHQPVNYASTAALPAYTYNNGTSGVGATITANANGALSLGGGSPTATQRVLVKDEVSGNAPYNGIYAVTQAGSSILPFILTRATDYDTSGTGTNEIDAGDYVLVISGTLASTAWVQQTPLPITVGTTAITFLQFNAPITYTAGTGLNLSPATTFNISNTGVTATTYGSASAVPVVTFNAQGQATGVTNTTIAIAGSQVSGNISGQAGSVANALTLGTYLTGGTYNGSAAVTATVDATSANTASKVVARDSSGNFSAGTITATLSGSSTSATTATNLAGGAANQIAYQSGSGTTTFATAPSASNQVLGWNGSAFSWSTGTISGIPLGSNLNSLTAGTYLTGTAYNGSAAQTWTVNAASANTASTVVARDASGNFSASTITASLSGNATSATNSTTTSQTNFSNLTIGSSQVLYAGNYNSYAPTLTGTGASGTWNINITGNAATATSATTAGSATTATTSTYSTYLSSVGSYVWNNATTSTGYVNGISNAFVSNAEGFPSYGDVMTMNSYPGGSGALQLFSPYGSAYPDLNLRFRTADYSAGGAWTAWKVILDAANYNSYAPTLTGTGASGTWSINVTGSAGSAGSATTAVTLTSTQSNWASTGVVSNVVGMLGWKNYGNSHVIFDASAGTSPSGTSVNNTNSQYAWTAAYPTLMGWNGGQTYGVRVDSARISDSTSGSAGSVDFANLTNKGSGTGTYTTSGDYRAPIFYDSDNTGYYVNPSSTSVINSLAAYANIEDYQAIGAGDDVRQGIIAYDSTAMAANVGGQFVFGYKYTAAGAYTQGAIIKMYKLNGTDGDYSSGLKFQVRNTGEALATRVWIDPTGNLYSDQSMRAPIFYDNDNTAYYLDAANSASAGALSLNGGITFGIANPYLTASSYIIVPGGAFFNSGTVYITSNLQARGGVGNDAAAALVLTGGTSGYTEINGSTRSPIYYDINNTSFFVDPYGTSNLTTIVVGYNSTDPYVYNVASTGVITFGTTSDLTNYSIQTALENYSGNYSKLRLKWYTGIQHYSSPTYGGHRFYDITGGTEYFGIAVGAGNNWSYSTYSHRAPIFYDLDNTGYYVDPASTTQLNVLLTAGNITSSGNVTAYSDERLKKDWDDLPSDFVPRLARVKSGTYTRIDNEMRQIGVGAQSLRPLMEEAVFENADGTLSVAYGNAAMASSVELARYVTALEQRISQLEARI